MIVICFFFPDILPEEYYNSRVPSVSHLTEGNRTVPSIHKPQEDPKNAPQGTCWKCCWLIFLLKLIAKLIKCQLSKFCRRAGLSTLSCRAWICSLLHYDHVFILLAVDGIQRGNQNCSKTPHLVVCFTPVGTYNVISTIFNILRCRAIWQSVEDGCVSVWYSSLSSSLSQSSSYQPITTTGLMPFLKYWRFIVFMKYSLWSPFLISNTLTHRYWWRIAVPTSLQLLHHRHFKEWAQHSGSMQFYSHHHNFCCCFICINTENSLRMCAVFTIHKLFLFNFC